VTISVDKQGRELTGDVVIRNAVEEAVLADSTDVLGVHWISLSEQLRARGGKFVNASNELIILGVGVQITSMSEGAIRG